jgi:CheY-like chemotaxis protein
MPVKHRHRILVVEDDADELGLAVLILESAGMTVDAARDGQEALGRLLTPGGPDAHPCFVLLDLKMPRMDGLEVARRLKADPATCAIPIVMFSSSCERRDLADGYRAGVNSYVVKPTDFGQLRAMLGEIAHYWLELNHAAVPV